MTEAIQKQRVSQVDDLIALLANTVGEGVSTEKVARCLTTAMAQLKGSVHPHDLPEMAYQLARIRLIADNQDHDDADWSSTPFRHSAS